MVYNDTIVAVIRNYRGQREDNYLMTLSDFTTWATPGVDSIEDTIEKMKSGEVSDGAFWANDTFCAWFCKPEEVKRFLRGKMNDNSMRMLFDNYDVSLSPKRNYETFANWYFVFDKEQSSYAIYRDYLKDNSELSKIIYGEPQGFLPPFREVLEEINNNFTLSVSYPVNEYDKDNKRTDNFTKERHVMSELSVSDLACFYEKAQKCVEALADANNSELFSQRFTAVIEEMQSSAESIKLRLNQLKANRLCTRCGSELYLSDLPQYEWVCPHCDENFN